jgi:hypothetical protein
VLDGIHRADPSTVGVLQRLAQDREVTLHDGTLLLSASRYATIKHNQGLDDAAMEAAGLLRIHPSFRMVGVGELVGENKKKGWANEELASMFDVHVVAALPRAEEAAVIRSTCPTIDDVRHYQCRRHLIVALICFPLDRLRFASLSTVLDSLRSLPS